MSNRSNSTLSVMEAVRPLNVLHVEDNPQDARAIRSLLDEQRTALAAGNGDQWTNERFVASCSERLAAQTRPSLKAVFNLTGTVDRLFAYLRISGVFISTAAAREGDAGECLRYRESGLVELKLHPNFLSRTD